MLRWLELAIVSFHSFPMVSLDMFVSPYGLTRLTNGRGLEVSLASCMRSVGVELDIEIHHASRNVVNDER